MRSEIVGPISVSSGPIQFLVGVTPTNVSSSNPLPVTVLGSIAVSQAPNTAGSYAEITNLTTTAQTFTKPANAVGFILEALTDNSVNLRWKIGATATISSGMRLEPGRDSGYVPCSANISIIAESGSSQIATVQWVLSS